MMLVSNKDSRMLPAAKVTSMPKKYFFIGVKSNFGYRGRVQLYANLILVSVFAGYGFNLDLPFNVSAAKVTAK